MKISDELKSKIEKAFPNNNELKDKLLAGDAEAIRSIGIMSGRGIAPEVIIKAYDSNNIEDIYNKAKKMLELRTLYEKLRNAYAENRLNSTRVDDER